jgi:hypothetical protein
VDSLLSNYFKNYRKLSGLDSRIDAISVILSHYNRDSVSSIFYDLTLSEAVIAVSLIKSKIDFNDY